MNSLTFRPPILRVALLGLLMTLTRPAAADSAVVFNEIMYHPAGTNEAVAEWVELQNQHAVDIDLSNWRLDGGIDFNFPEGTILRAGGHLVIASSPASLAGATGLTNILGPYRNRLANGGDRLRLRNNDGRVINEVNYGVEGEWPVAPDGAGPSLARRTRNLPAAEPATWTASAQPAGTPGRENFPVATVTLVTTNRVLVPVNSEWRYDASGANLGSFWRDPAFADAGWLSGPALLGNETAALPEPLRTTLPLGPTNYYFRRTFTFTGNPATTTLALRHILDDGMIVYLNGAELVRVGMPAGNVTPATFANVGVGDAAWSGILTLPGTNLVNGNNTLAVEVHQASAGSSDIVFGLELSESFSSLVTNLPAGVPPPPPTLAFNELASSTNNAFWLELINTGTSPVNLGGCTIARFGGATNREVTLPAEFLPPGGLRLIPRGELGFGADSGDRLVLYSPGRSNVIDAVVAKKDPRGRRPDGTGGWWFPRTATPGESNVFRWHGDVVLNEMMYHPRPQLAAPAVASSDLFLRATNVWRYFAAGTAPTGDWKAPGYNDLAWNSGPGVFHAPTNLILAVPKGTPLRLTNAAGQRIITFYFRTEFTFNGDPAGLLPTLRPIVDDGAVFYLNGVEVHRMNLPLTNITYGTLALTNVGVPGFYPAVTLAGGLVPGVNTLAVEVHQVVANSSDFGFGCEFGVTRVLSPAVPHQESGDTWVELHNRGSNTVDLAGWRLDDGIDFRFGSPTLLAPGGFLVVAREPAALRARVPGITVLGPFTNQLSRNGEMVSLKDPDNNPADVVRYFSGGRWPEAADGTGASLEVRDPRADRSNPATWAASDESARAPWQTYTHRLIANPGQSGEPTLWHEFILGILDGAGEVLLDDISVIETPSTTPRQLIQNGTFAGGSSAHWRFVGNHRLSRVEPDPDQPGNFVLRLVAGGATEYQGNQVETTFTNNVALVDGREYEVSFRARWVSGQRWLHSRAYFNRLARTVPLAVSPLGGTPGARNSRFTTNAGPTFDALRHTPVVPNAGQAVAVSVAAADPDGLATATLRYSVNGGAWQSTPMASADGRQFAGTIPGQAAAAIVQFYVEAADARGATATMPARGPASRALYTVQDGQATGAPAHHFRLILTRADATFLHTGTNTLSNELLGATVIDDEREPYYDAAVRLKGSFVGRNVARVGFHVQFPDDHLFRGEHRIVSLDRSAHTIIGGVAELLVKHIAGHAGGIPSMYDDVARFIHSAQPSYNSTATLRLTGFDNDWLDAMYENGSDGSVFEVEVLRWNLSTVDGNPESPKQVGNEGGGTGYANLELQDRGDSAENYRWFLLKVNNRTADDYAGAMAFARALGLPTGTNFDARTAATMDVDQWLRVMAFQCLVGPGDAYYTGANIHNFRFFVRPGDQRTLYLPWDWDSCFQTGTGAPLIGGGNIAKLVGTVANRRRYYCHLHDLVRTTYNSAYMSRWTAHYGSVAAQDLSGYLGYIAGRASFVSSQLPTAAFAVTNNAGNNFTLTNGSLALGGTAPLSVATITINGIAYPVTWLSDTAWRINLPLAAGANSLVVAGLDKQGNPAPGASDTITVTNTGPAALLPVTINEWMADNEGPGGFPDPADGLFQDWFELFNPNPVTVALGDLHLTDDLANPVRWRIPTNIFISARGYLLVWADNNPAQNPAGGGTNIDLHAPFSLNSNGEAIGLFARDGITPVSTVTFGRQSRNMSGGRFPDGDTNGVRVMANWTPRAANTLDPFPPLRITGLNREAGELRFSWNTVPGHAYQIQATENLPATNWLPAGPVIRASGATSGSTDAVVPGAGQRYYRVVQLP